MYGVSVYSNSLKAVSGPLVKRCNNISEATGEAVCFARWKGDCYAITLGNEVIFVVEKISDNVLVRDVRPKRMRHPFMV